MKNPGSLSPPTQRRTWITRRRANYLLIAAATLSIAGMTRMVSAQRALKVSQAMQFIQQAGDKLIVILNGPGDSAAKQRQLVGLINEVVDVRGIARFSLGRFWNAMSAEQREEYVHLFPAVLIGGIGRSVGAYAGVKFSIDRGAQIDDNIQVWTTVIRPGDHPRQVTWIIGEVVGVQKIVDIVAEGSSLRITQRDDCASFLAHNNHSIEALIETLRRQAEVTS